MRDQTVPRPQHATALETEAGDAHSSPIPVSEVAQYQKDEHAEPKQPEFEAMPGEDFSICSPPRYAWTHEWDCQNCEAECLQHPVILQSDRADR